MLKHHARGHKISIPTDVPASENGAEMNSQADESSGEDELTSSTGMMLINDDDMKEKGWSGHFFGFTGLPILLEYPHLI
ncbi:unnamed protein product [Haemonchus placei]|uniref:Uncharacterized protein n=1 Tax=Haemonchus placei TaxID=6290 RepID=A0A3P7T086_HAEPC|nr:unnamed protein product [Haemonchus placei]